MPVSDVRNIAPILNEVVQIQPKTVLELGIGFGKYGVLIREVLDAVNGNVDKDAEGTTLIEGVEGFESYRNPAWGVYDGVRVSDFTALSPVYLSGWDLVLMIDSLEHVEKDRALKLLDWLVSDNKRVIVSVPVGHHPQGAVFGNEFERHRSEWSGPQEFSKYHYKVLHQSVCCVVSIKGMR